MKKLIVILLLLAVICSLFGCDSDNKANGSTGSETGDSKEGYYSLTVTGSKDSLMKALKSKYKAGEVVKIKAYPVTDISLHVFVNGEQIPMSHWDSDYWGFEFVMPEEDVTVHLTYDQFYGREEYLLSDLYVAMMYLERYGDDIDKICIRSYRCDEKYSIVENRYSSKSEDIENYKAMFNQSVIKLSDSNTEDPVYRREYSFFYKDSEFSELCFYDQVYHWNDFSTFQHFKFKDPNYVLPTIEDPDLITYSFIYDGYSSDVKSYDSDTFSERFFQIDSIEFIPYEGEKINIDPTYYIDSRYGIINLITSTVFELNGEYYEIVGESNYWAWNYLGLGN